jgi:hypothetical protein
VADVASAIAAGRMEGEPMLVSISLWGAVHGLTSLLISKPRFPWPDVDAMIDQVIRTVSVGTIPRG